jgi:4-amino-4-deoxy-L-arabinose transferase-like glycosyltransferase
MVRATGGETVPLLRGGWPYAWLTLLCAVLYLPGLSTVPVIDRDEARYVQATRQMLESGDLVSIRFQDAPRNKKPAGVHWLQAASVALVSDAAATTLWPYRVPSALGAWSAVLLTFGFARRRLGDGPAVLASAGLAGSLALAAEAHQAKTDAVLLAAVALTQFALARAYLAWRGPAEPVPGPRNWLAFWGGLGVAFLLKGPVGPGVTALTVLALVALHREARWLLALRPLPGVLVTLAVALPWSLAVSLGEGGEFFREAATRDWLPKLLSGQESHGAPPGYYALTLLVTLWPASLLLLPALLAAWRDRADPLVAFALAWALPAWALLEVVPTKLPHYVLPLFPALVLLVGRVLGKPAGPRATRAVAAYVVLWLLATLAVASVLLVLPLLLGLGLPAWAVGLVLVLVLAGVAAALAAMTGGWGRALALGLAGTPVLVPWLAVAYLPRLTPAWTSHALVQAIARVGAFRAQDIAVAGYGEPSLVFLAGTRVRLTDPREAARHLAAGPGRLAVVSERRQAAFEQSLAETGVAARPVGTVRGFNYSRGRWATLHLYVAGERG